MDKKKVCFYYDSNSKSKLENILGVIVNFYSEDIISEEEYKKLYNDFNEYLSYDKSYDIVEVTSKIKEIFKGLNENKLEISIKMKDYVQKVTYINGKITESLFSIVCWNDLIEVKTHYDDISINFKKENFEFTKGKIHTKIDYFIDKLLNLKKLEKKEKNKTYKK